MIQTIKPNPLVITCLARHHAECVKNNNDCINHLIIFSIKSIFKTSTDLCWYDAVAGNEFFHLAEFVSQAKGQWCSINQKMTSVSDLHVTFNNQSGILKNYNLSTS